MKRKKYSLSEEHKSKFPEWRDKWIKNAMSTSAMTEEDKKICIESIKGMYSAAKLSPPKNIVFVSSPFVMRYAGGAAAWIWYNKNKKAATRDAIETAIWDATAEATWNATRDATEDATREATRKATEDATRAATRAAIETATREATREATEDATREATRDKRKWYLFNDDISWMTHEMLQCADYISYMWQGGNQWSGYDSFLSFFDRVVGLNLPEYKAYRHWEQLALHSGPRIVHRDFVIISDRPKILMVDNQNRPNCETGPFCRWRDGSSLYAIHGVRTPAWIVEKPEDITVENIEAETNTEIRRIMIAKFGTDKYVQKSGAKETSKDEFGTLWRKEVPGDEPILMVEVVNSTPEPDGSNKHYWIRVPPNCKKAHEAVAWTFGVRMSDYKPNRQT